MTLCVELGLRIGFHVREPFVAIHRADGGQVLEKLSTVEIITGFCAHHHAQDAPAADGVDFLTVRTTLVDPQLTYPESGALVDGDRDLYASPVRCEHDARCVDRDLKESLIVVKPADHRDIALESVLSERPSGTECKEAALAREHGGAKLFGGNGLVANERHAPNTHLIVLGVHITEFHPRIGRNLLRLVVSAQVGHIDDEALGPHR